MIVQQREEKKGPSYSSPVKDPFFFNTSAQYIEGGKLEVVRYIKEKASCQTFFWKLKLTLIGEKPNATHIPGDWSEGARGAKREKYGMKVP